ncbi:MFS transporter [Methylovirgula sp. 4M-Z18]|uniref:MFS transporter n=1 Tax=Methylovirgula sp. 4M-Z18 TaxID=2293567 RepID=UPI000E2E4748|nr:MFS transporter [Methylovirgula sp. 4M-Z18]RFB80112.1 MFS transporter [Methylovirgula sp. 4M-Z18]
MSSSRAPSLLYARLGTAGLFFANGFGMGSWATAIPQLKRHLALTDTELSFALLAMSIGAVAAMPFSTLFINRLNGSGRALRYSSVFFALLITLPGFMPDLVSLAVLVVFLGLFVSLMDVPMNAHAAQVETRWGAAIMSSFHACWSLGGLAGATIGGMLTNLGVQLPWTLLIAGLIVLGVVAASLPPIGPGEKDQQERHFAWPERPLIGLCVVALFTMLVEGAMADWSGVYLMSIIAASPGAAASGFAVYSGAMVVGRLSGDYVVRSLGRARAIQFGAIMAAAGILAALSADGLPLALAGFCLVGLGLANMIPAVFSMSATLGSTPALGISMAATIGYAGFLVGPPIIGGIAGYGGLRVAFVPLLLAMLSIGMIALAIRPARSAQVALDEPAE